MDIKFSERNLNRIKIVVDLTLDIIELKITAHNWIYIPFKLIEDKGITKEQYIRIIQAAGVGSISNIRPNFPDEIHEVRFLMNECTVKNLMNYKLKFKESYLEDFEWIAYTEKHRGVLTIKNSNKTFEFQGGNFGGINILFQNYQHDITPQELKSAIKDHYRGQFTDIEISDWKKSLKSKRKEFFQYFTIQGSPLNKPTRLRILRINDTYTNTPIN